MSKTLVGTVIEHTLDEVEQAIEREAMSFFNGRTFRITKIDTQAQYIDTQTLGNDIDHIQTRFVSDYRAEVV